MSERRRDIYEQDLQDKVASSGSLLDTTSSPASLRRLKRSELPVLAAQLRQELIETSNVRKRLETLVRELSKEIEDLELRNKIQEQVQEPDAHMSHFTGARCGAPCGRGRPSERLTGDEVLQSIPAARPC